MAPQPGTPPTPLVGIIMGSKSDWETMSHVADTLARLAVPHETRVVSAHRTPDLLFEYAASAASRASCSSRETLMRFWMSSSIAVAMRLKAPATVLSSTTALPGSTRAE